MLAALIQYFDIKVLHISTEMYAVKEHEMKFNVDESLQQTKNG